MYVGSLPSTTDNETFVLTTEATNSENGTPIDLSSAEIEFVIRDPVTKTEMLSATESDMTIGGAGNNVFTVTFTVAQMNTLCAKEYEATIRITVSGVTVEPFVGTLSVLDG